MKLTYQIIPNIIHLTTFTYNSITVFSEVMFSLIILIIFLEKKGHDLKYIIINNVAILAKSRTI